MVTGTSPDQQPAISAAASRRERHPGDSCGCLAGRCAVSRRFSEVEVAEVWERRHTGEPTPSIARRPGTQGSSIRGVFEDSSGVAAGDSLCVIRERPPPGTRRSHGGGARRWTNPVSGPSGGPGSLAASAAALQTGNHVQTGSVPNPERSGGDNPPIGGPRQTGSW